MFSAGRECFRRSLKNSRGESLVETLVAILVGALAMTLLASMIVTSTRLTQESSKTIDEYYASNNLVAAKSDDGKVTGEGTIVLNDKDGFPKYLRSDGSDVKVEYYVNNADSKNPVVAYVILDAE